MSKSKVDGQTVESKEEHPFSINSLLVNDKGLFFLNCFVHHHFCRSKLLKSCVGVIEKKKFYH